MSQIETLTPAQAQRLPYYRERWRSLLQSTQPLDPAQASQAVQVLYQTLGQRSPQIRFLRGPSQIRTLIQTQSVDRLVSQLGLPLLLNDLSQKKILQPIEAQIAPPLWQTLQGELLDFQLQQLFFQRQIPLMEELGQVSSTDLEAFLSQLPQEIWQEFWVQQQLDLRDHLLKQPGGDWLVGMGDWLVEQTQPLWQEFETHIWHPLVQPTLDDLALELQPLLTVTGFLGVGIGAFTQVVQELPLALVDFCVEELNCRCDRVQWSALKQVYQTCSLVLPFTKTCLVMERPSHFQVDDQGQLHREGEPAIAYGDGYRLYAFHGVILPPRYAQVHPHQWQSRWLLSEPNAELRRALIQGIGYARLCQELEAAELDHWREYTLLRIDSDIDVEPIHLLKMVCPSTHYIHATRVPPTLRSAREAIRWVNWGTDPTEFGMET